MGRVFFAEACANLCVARCCHERGTVRTITPSRIRKVKAKPIVMVNCHAMKGHAVAKLVEALRYTPGYRGFDSRLCHWNFSLT